MATKNLNEFIASLQERGELTRITELVSPHLEITEITDRVIKGPSEKNKALLFENPQGYDIPVLINLFGSAQRMAWALGVNELDDLNLNLSKVVDPRLPKGFGEMLGRGREL